MVTSNSPDIREIVHKCLLGIGAQDLYEHPKGEDLLNGNFPGCYVRMTMHHFMILGQLGFHIYTWTGQGTKRQKSEAMRHTPNQANL
jgi:hypothetical protein